tara:strand:+ start:1968 stop:4463 length:2496 start_codon:yes stop_codon:yes gene_type:complete
MPHTPHATSPSSIRHSVSAAALLGFAAFGGCASPADPPPTSAIQATRQVPPNDVVWSADIVAQDAGWFASDAAVRIANNVLRYQSAEGGWPKNVDLAQWPPRAQDAAFATDGKANTFDNDATTVPMEFLAQANKATGIETYREAFERGLDYTLAAQYANGGWPQYYPSREGYYTHITFNDDAMVRVMFLLSDIAAGTEPFAFVDGTRRAQAADAVARGTDLILRTQIRQDGQPTAWCAQYDENTLEPAWARAYEPPSLSGNESVGILRYLMSLEDPSPDIVAAVHGGVQWLESAAIAGIRIDVFTNADGQTDKQVVSDASAGPIWARFYELETGRPLFLGRDSVFRYSFAEIEHERRNGYGYYGYWPRELIEVEYPAWKAKHTRNETLIAFPGAEGYGKFTRGGRGGDVYEVTNLNDSGPGSLRAAIEAPGPRTVVFRVSGTIDLQGDLVVSNPYLTIAGQTAPGDGITLKRHPLIISADDVIVRYIRVRLGAESGESADAITGMYHKNLMIDHVSASWSVDETVSVYHGENVTLQWSVISESLYESVHQKGGSHGFGGIWGSNFSTYHHNLIAHHSSRNPRFASGSGNVDFRNNVVYNWGYKSTYGGETVQVGHPDTFNYTNINMVANYYKPGPATLPGRVSHQIANPWSRNKADDYGKWYIADNAVGGHPDVTAENWDGGVQPEDGDEYIAGLRLAEPWPAMEIRQQSAEDAYLSVLDKAGASLPGRDAVDARIIAEARNGTATFEGPTYKRDHAVADTTVATGIIDSPSDVGGWPTLNSTPAPADSDHDGMPDDWEREHDLNPQDPTDRNLVASDGYTMLEKYLNSID